MKGTQTSTRSTGPAEEQADGFSAEERDAIKQRAKELRAAGRGRGAGAAKPDPEVEVLAKIAEMEDADRVLAEQLHAMVRASAPDLSPKLWYGMPAYARAGKIVCFFQSAQKFKSRYATLGFSDPANLDEGTMWPTSYALTKLTPADEELIAGLIRKAVS
ncbi:iron chaperone [Streptomyces sp. NPDC097617]|uniref:iron chaperone n=1 Tax=Streptomyces sp. NPDC097617 TaxID=3366091 RepID=UPI0037FE7959